MQITFEELKKFPQIILKSNAKNPTSINVGVESDMRHWYTSDISMKIQLIENAMGWGRLPAHLIKEKIGVSLQEITHLPILKSIDVPLFLVRLKRKAMGPNTLKLWNQLLKLV